jgi:hypothetical protein
VSERTSLVYERLGLPVLASAIRESHKVLKRIYSTPEVEKSLVATLNHTVGKEILDPADCGGDLGVVVVIVVIAAPKMPEPGDIFEKQI